MAAPHIPNLTALRNSRGGRVARRVPRDVPTTARLLPDFDTRSATAGGLQAEVDKRVQLTDLDASHSRLSAAALGYFSDAFAREFHTGPTPRRQPIINRGTYVRTTAIDKLVEAFIASNEGCETQIISLGAGTDTRYWRLREKKLHLNLLYHEIDFPEVSKHKLNAVCGSKALSPVSSSVYNMPSAGCWGFFRDREERHQGYIFHPYDLRKLPAKLPDLNRNVPTLLISECALCYLSNADAKRVLANFTKQLPTLGIVLYEPTNPLDEFGRMMVQNLANRHLILPSLTEYPDIDSQLLRLQQAQFVNHQNGATVSWLWKKWTSDEEKLRISKLEMVDELEEWELLSSHYLVMWACREFGDTQGAFNQWTKFPGEVYATKHEVPVAVLLNEDSETDYGPSDDGYGPDDDHGPDDGHDPSDDGHIPSDVDHTLSNDSYGVFDDDQGSTPTGDASPGLENSQ